MVLVASYFFTTISRVSLFWAAFILTPPLGVWREVLPRPMSVNMPRWANAISDAI